MGDGSAQPKIVRQKHFSIYKDERQMINNLLLMSVSICFTLYCPYFQYVRAADIVIDLGEVPPEQNSTSLDIVSLRSIAEDIDTTNNHNSTPEIPKDVLARAAIAIPQLRAQFSSAKPASEYSWADINQVYSYLSSPSGKALLDTIGNNSTRSLVESGLVDSETILSETTSGATRMAWDPIAVVNLAGHGIVNLHDRIFEANQSGGPVITIDNKYQQPVFAAYEAYKDGLKQMSPASAALRFDQSMRYVRNYDSLERALLEKLGQLLFGAPIIYTSEEKSLSLPSSIRRSFDVIWAEFPVTLLLKEPIDLNEIYIELGLPEGYRVLDLLPLTIGVESETAERLASPNIKVPTPLGEVEVGEVFSRTVAVKNIKPVVVGAGLGLNWFSWQMSKEAASSGSRKFVAIIGTPKGTREFNVSASGHIRIQRTAQNYLLGYGDLAGTGVGTVPVSY